MTRLTAAQLAELGGVDVLVGGTPCQPFSSAGRRAGFADARSKLTLDFCRLADELHAPHVLWENVPGVLWHDQGRTFAHILSLLSGAEITAPPSGWQSGGAAWGPKRVLIWRVLDAQYFGVPQRRRRVFLYAVATDLWRVPFGALWAADAACDPRGMVGMSLRLEQICSALSLPGWRRTQRFARALAQRGECVTLVLPETPMPDAVIPSSLTDVVEPWGPHLARYQLAPSTCRSILTRAGQRRRSLPAMLRAALMQIADGEIGVTDLAGCDRQIVTSLCASFGIGGPDLAHAQAGWLIAQEVSAFKPSHFTRGKDGAPSEVVPPLSADADLGDQDIYIFETRLARNGRGKPAPIAPALRAQNGDHGTGDGAPILLVPLEWGSSHPDAPHIVRRLTPLEWERLQGFPDHWTRIPYRGRDAADRPRYRALGNTMAVPCMRWLGRRIDRIHRIASRSLPSGVQPAGSVWHWRGVAQRGSR